MPTFTTRFLNVVSAQINGDFALDDVAALMNGKRPDHQLLEGGWASIADEGSNLGVINAAPPVSDVEILPETEAYPERLVARYYYFSERKGLRDARPDASEAELHEVAAIDITISPDVNGRYLLLISTRDMSSARKHVLKRLGLLLETLDPDAVIDLSRSPIAFPSSDVYLWLMVKARDSRHIDDATEIRSIEAVHGQDTSYRVTVLNDAVSFDRPGFLIAVAEGDELGPAKLTLFDSSSRVRICFNVWPSGSFAVITGATYYPDIMDTSAWRLVSVFDVAYVYLPKIVAAYRADAGWGKTVRAAEIRAAAEALVARYTVEE